MKKRQVIDRFLKKASKRYKDVMIQITIAVDLTHIQRMDLLRSKNMSIGLCWHVDCDPLLNDREKRVVISFIQQGVSWCSYICAIFYKGMPREEMISQLKARILWMEIMLQLRAIAREEEI